jgi:SPX domain protein involved in polyphosphate accumulation
MSEGEETTQRHGVSERIAKVEVRVDKVEMRADQTSSDHTRLSTRVDKQDGFISRIIEQQHETNAMSIAIRERTDQHTKNIEHLQADAVDVGKMLSSMKVQLELVKVVGTTLATLVLGYLFTHFVK